MRLVAVIEIAYLKEVFNLLLRQVGPHRLLPLRLLPVRRQGVEAALVVVPVTEDDVGAFLDRLDLAGERVAFLWMTVSFSFLFFFWTTHKPTYLVVLFCPAVPVPCGDRDLVQHHKYRQIDGEEVLWTLACHHPPELLEQLLPHPTQDGAVPHIVELGTYHSGDVHVIGVGVTVAPVWLHVEKIRTFQSGRSERVSYSGLMRHALLSRRGLLQARTTYYWQTRTNYILVKVQLSPFGQYSMGSLSSPCQHLLSKFQGRPYNF